MAKADPAPRTVLSETLFRLFRAVALLEGVAPMALFLVAMPIKYGLDNPLWGRGWSGPHGARTTSASFMPFDTFLNDPVLMRRKAAEVRHVVE